MAITFELNDGSTTLDLTDGTNYSLTGISLFSAGNRVETFAGNELRRVKFVPYRIDATVNIKGANIAGLLIDIRALTSMLRRAENRMVLDVDTTKIVLKYQLGDTGADDISQRVLSGNLVMPDSVLDQVIVDQNITIDAQLSLLLEPQGRLADESPTPVTVENEVDGAGENFMDIDNVVGTSGGRLELKVHDADNGGANAWTGDKKMWIAMRTGERKTDTLFIQAPDSVTEVADPTTVAITTASGTTGGLTTNASAGNSAFVSWTNDGSSNTNTNAVIITAFFQYDIATLPVGRYQVLCRASLNESDLPANVRADWALGLGFVFGGKTSTPTIGGNTLATSEWTQFDNADADDEWHTMDLGELLIPAIGVPGGSGTDPTLNLRVNVGWHGTSQIWGANDAVQVDIDHIWLLSVDEGVVIVDSVGTDDRVLISNKAGTPGVWLLNTSDVVQSFASFSGGPFNIGPEDTRIYWLRDDVGDPTTTQAVLTPIYTPLIQGI